jgi:hypothetical protein
MRKSLRIGAVLLGLAILLLGALLLVDLDSPVLGKKLLDAVGEKAGIRLTADGFHLNLLRGLRLDGVRMEMAGPSGRLTIAAPGLLAEHRLLPLLGGRFVIDRVALYQPRIELVTPPAHGAPPPPLSPTPVRPTLPATQPAPAAGAPGAAPASNVVLRIDRIDLRDGVLATRTEGQAAADVEIRGLGVGLRDLAFDSAAPTAVQALTATGDLTTREIAIGTLQALDGSGVVKLAAGHFRLEKFNLKLPQGPFLLGEFDADLNRDPFAYRFACQIDPLDTNGVLAGGKAKGLGPGKLVFTARGTGTETRDMIGDGTVALAAGQVPGSPIFQGLEAVLGRARLTGSAYEPFTVSFHIRRDRLTLDPFEMRTALLALGLRGWADLAGPIDLRIAVKAPRDLVALARVPPRILDAVAADGMVTVPLRVTGTPDVPRVAADGEALRAQGFAVVCEEVRHRVQDAAGRLFRKLFGNR